MKKLIVSTSLIIMALSVLGVASLHAQDNASDNATQTQPDAAADSEQTALFAGGCFWCIEADFEKLDGVSTVVSGYTGGEADTASYKIVTDYETGHYEAVRVHYDPSVVSYSELVEYFWRHIDPTNAQGQFCDTGSSYRSAIFYANQQEQEVVEASLARLQNNKPFDEAIVTYIGEAKPFYLAEQYHQDYYKKNPLRYRAYRYGCGRDKRVEQLWGD